MKTTLLHQRNVTYQCYGLLLDVWTDKRVTTFMEWYNVTDRCYLLLITVMLHGNFLHLVLSQTVLLTRCSSRQCYSIALRVFGRNTRTKIFLLGKWV